VQRQQQAVRGIYVATRLCTACHTQTESPANLQLLLCVHADRTAHDSLRLRCGTHRSTWNSSGMDWRWVHAAAGPLLQKRGDAVEPHLERGRTGFSRWSVGCPEPWLSSQTASLFAVGPPIWPRLTPWFRGRFTRTVALSTLRLLEYLLKEREREAANSLSQNTYSASQRVPVLFRNSAPDVTLDQNFAKF